MAKTMLSIRKIKIEGEAVLKLFSQEFRLEEMETTPLLLSDYSISSMLKIYSDSPLHGW